MSNIRVVVTNAVVRVDACELGCSIVTTLRVSFIRTMLCADTVARRQAVINQEHLILVRLAATEQQICCFHVCMHVLLLVNVLQCINLNKHENHYDYYLVENLKRWGNSKKREVYNLKCEDVNGFALEFLAVFFEKLLKITSVSLHDHETQLLLLTLNLTRTNVGRNTE